MWMFCKSGMFSAVAHNEKAGVILLRARLEGDLERLLRVHKMTDKYKVVATPDNDYRFRVEMAREDWVRCVTEEATDIDYGNFKNKVHDGTERDEAYMGCWSAMRDAQDAQMYGRDKRGNIRWGFMRK